MNIPDAAFEAAAERLYQFNEWGIDSNGDYYKNQCSWDSTSDSTQDIYRREASAAIEAAMPAIREAIAEELIRNGPVLNWELNHDGTEDPVRAAYVEAFRDAARYVRGGTP